MKDKITSLYLVPTPIGNMEDITYRAITVLNAVDIVLAEDSRTSGKLLKHFSIDKPVRSYHMHNEHQTVQSLINKMEDGATFALISDAGTPGISDPGYLLVRACLQADLKVECLPGPTAFVPALVKSGIPCDSFLFLGFLPHKKGRATLMKQIAVSTRTVVFYESPHRLIKCLDQLIEHCGPNRLVSVSRELTKIYEETITDTLENTKKYFEEAVVKGEFVIVVSAAD